MNKLLEQMESCITKTFPEGNAIRSKYYWVKERFELEYKEEAIIQERLAEFLSQVWCDGSFVKEELEKHLDAHVEYLAKLEKDEDKIDQEWKKSPEEFVTKLANYRANGSMDTNLSKQLLDFAKNINNDPLRYIYEIIQNADDCDYIAETPEITISLEDNSTEGNSTEGNSTIEVHYNEVGMRYTDVLAITTIGQSNKQNRIKKRIIGEKGIGFKTIFSVCESVDIWSGGYSFALHDKNFVPKYLEANKESKENQGTTLHLHLKSKTETETENATLQINAQKVFDNLKEKYGFPSEGKNFCAQNAFQNCPILFTNRLHAITIRKGKESFSIKKNENNDEGAILYFINDKKVGEIGYFRITRDVTFEYTEYCSRYEDQFQDGNVYTKAAGEVKTYPLEIVAAKDATSIKQGCVYSYLPTSTKIKAPFNIQIPAKLNLDRSCIYFIGDSDTNSQQQSQVNTDNPETIAWNERLMKELFFSADPLIQEFYDILKKKTDIFLYIPTFEKNDHQLFAGDEKYSAAIKNLNTYCGKHCGKRDLFTTFQNIPYFKVDDNEYCTAEQAVMFDKFIDSINFNTYYYDRLKADGQLKEKAYLVKHHPNAVEKTKCFGFDLYSIGEKQKAEYMNETLEKTNWENIEIIQEEVVNSNNRSKYISEDVLQLRIFPTYNKDEGVQYRSYKNSAKNNFWFQEVDDCKIYSNGQICIFAKEYWRATQLPKEVELPKQTSENIWDKVFQEQIGKDLFEELIDLLFRMGAFEGYSKESWQKAIEQFLKDCEKENTDFWVKEANNGIPRMKQLAIFLQKNASKFANEVGETE